jgi:exopolysaccharide biosynthesis polyprenyl glycosylphosphotransferase
MRVAPAEKKRRRWRIQTGERRLLLIFGDLIAASAATFIALYLWAQFDWLGFSPVFFRFRAAWFVSLPVVWLILMINNYDVVRAGSLRETVKGLLFSGAGGIVLYLVLYFTSSPGSLPRRGVLYFLFLVFVFTLIWRWSYIRVFTAPAFLRRVLIVGAGESGKTIYRVITALTPPPFEIVGFVDDDPDKLETSIGEFQVLGGSKVLAQLIESNAITDLIVAITGPMHAGMFKAVLEAQEQGIVITRMPVAYEELLGRLPINHLESDWLVRSFVDEIRVPPMYTISKRLIDLVGSFLGLLILGLLMPVIAIAILIESGRPIFYVQDRLGQGGLIYGLVKFRTMDKDAEADGEAHWAMEGDPRATNVGVILRKTHLDEFPQFVNVLKGDMSIVGPRPERPELVVDLERQIPFYRARLFAKPGITGWAQVNYGKGASIEGSAEKLEYDLFYIKNRSLWLDLWILVRTVGSVLGLRGV